MTTRVIIPTQSYGTLGPPKQQTLATALKTKNAERREKFRKLGQAITQLEKDWRDYKGDHQFEFKPTASADPATKSEGGPCLKTVQFHRTIRK